MHRPRTSFPVDTQSDPFTVPVPPPSSSAPISLPTARVKIQHTTWAPYSSGRVPNAPSSLLPLASPHSARYSKPSFHRLPTIAKANQAATHTNSRTSLTTFLHRSPNTPTGAPLWRPKYDLTISPIIIAIGASYSVKRPPELWNPGETKDSLVPTTTNSRTSQRPPRSMCRMVETHERSLMRAEDSGGVITHET